MRPTLLNRNAVVVGFDADTDKCGIAVYDVAGRSVQTWHLRPYLAVGQLLELGIQHGKRAIFRIEIPDQKSAYGASKAGKSRTVHSIAFGSGMAAGIAEMAVTELEAAGFRVERVKGSKRYNLDNKHRGRVAVNSLPFPAQVQALKVSMPTMLPSKASAELALHFFPTLEGQRNNKETRDALFLAWPERYMFG